MQITNNDENLNFAHHIYQTIGILTQERAQNGVDSTEIEFERNHNTI